MLGGVVSLSCRCLGDILRKQGVKQRRKCRRLCFFHFTEILLKGDLIEIFSTPTQPKIY